MSNDKVFRFVAGLSSGLFTGSCVYVNAVQNKANLRLDSRHAVDYWNYMFKRAAPFQAGLVLVASSSSLVVYYLKGENEYLYSSLLLAAVLPYTFLALMPTNYRLLDKNLDKGSEESKQLISKWAKLHSVRSLLGLAAFSLILWNA